jgi:hypothetical protein
MAMLRLISKNNSGAFAIPVSWLTKDCAYQVRIFASSEAGKIIGYSSDPVAIINWKAPGMRGAKYSEQAGLAGERVHTKD